MQINQLTHLEQLGPIVGGWILQSIDSWRWSFYVCAIATAIVIVMVAILLPETYAPKLNRKERPSLREIPRALKRPLHLLATQPIIQVLAAYGAIIFGIYYLFLTTISRTFKETYGQSIGISSLHYLAMLLGFILSVGVSGKAMDKLYKKFSQDGTFPEARMPYLAASGSILPAGLLLYGWTAQYRVFWLAPDVGLFLVGTGILAPLIAIQHYTLDCYSKRGFAASAMAGMNVLRFLAGFAFPLFADGLFGELGLGWGNSVLALVAFVVGGLSVSLWWLGPLLRRKSSKVEI
jgi:MFS family permease